MFSKRRDGLPTDPVDTLIGKGASFEGVLKASGTIRIEGSLSGELCGDADVVIGESGKLAANVQGKNVVLAGEVRGNITASGRTEITPSGRLFGDLKTNSLVIDEGAVFCGKCLADEEGKAPPAAAQAEGPA